MVPASMELLCPHCQSSIEPTALSDASRDVLCGSCGSTFRVESEHTLTWDGNLRRTFGRFELLTVAGNGAFGTVYKARDPALDRLIALKVPRSGSLPDHTDLDRFLREARSAARLRHSGIVPIHEVGQQDEIPYLVAEF